MAHQPDIADLKRTLGINLFLELDEHALIDTRRQGLVCRFLGQQLSSVFQPIQNGDGVIIGREALLRSNTVEALAPQAAFAQAITAHKLVSFDRLVRTIHLLNHASTFAGHELIFLNVHPQLLTSVNDHGRTFEQILHYYSVPTSQVVIEIQESAIKDDSRLEAAVNNYRALGYRIAVDNFGAGHGSLNRVFHPPSGHNRLGSLADLAWLNRVLNLRPDYVKFDGAMIRQAGTDPQTQLILRRLVSVLHGNGAQVVIQHIETHEQAEIAQQAGAQLLQGNHLGEPEFSPLARGALCRDGRLAA